VIISDPQLRDIAIASDDEPVPVAQRYDATLGPAVRSAGSCWWP